MPQSFRSCGKLRLFRPRPSAIPWRMMTKLLRGASCPVGCALGGRTLLSRWSRPWQAQSKTESTAWSRSWSMPLHEFASMLATMLGASERSIRNYVTEINGQGDTIIESSKEGYRLAHADAALSSPACPSIKSAPERGGEPTGGIGIDARCNYVASHLVNAREPLSGLRSCRRALHIRKHACERRHARGTRTRRPVQSIRRDA